jgi:hypothetical protein
MSLVVRPPVYSPPKAVFRPPPTTRTVGAEVSVITLLPPASVSVTALTSPFYAAVRFASAACLLRRSSPVSAVARARLRRARATRQCQASPHVRRPRPRPSFFC